MRYQEPIYIQNENGAVRNKDILNVNMSSDVCVFESPKYSLSGASKIDCTGSTSGTSYIISATTQNIPLTFDFTANTSSFVNTNALFRFEVYKYSDIFSGFSSTPVYKSETLDYSTFSATNITTQYVPSSGITLDGEYIIKPYYSFGICTDFLSKLNKTVDTSTFISGTEYGIYNNEFDYYFIAINQAEIPVLTQNSSNLSQIGQLKQQVIIPTDGQTTFNIQNGVNGDFVVTLNGLVLALNLDYSFSGNVVFLSGETFSDDIITVFYATAGGYNMISDNLNVYSPIVSGVTDNQGSNMVYFNITSNKYEIYTSVIPLDGSSIIVMLNGATLADNIDYFQSTTNPKRIILQGTLMVNDIITIVYFPRSGTAMGLNTNNPMVTWSITNAPTAKNGYFALEVSTGDTFTSLYYSGNTNYEIGANYYNQSFIASGTVGTTLYYRVRNDKNYTTICGDNLNSTSYSEIIPVVIESNSINSY